MSDWRITIIWNEAMTEGVAVTDQAQVDAFTHGTVDRGGLLETLIDRNPGDDFIQDEVWLSAKTGH